MIVIGAEEADAAIVTTVIGMARALKLKVVAERVLLGAADTSQ
jgi:EAL domain-containing protein (putative c-di-GMP-specific phosphodiesterase class I)